MKLLLLCLVWFSTNSQTISCFEFDSYENRGKNGWTTEHVYGKFVFTSKSVTVRIGRDVKVYPIKKVEKLANDIIINCGETIFRIGDNNTVYFYQTGVYKKFHLEDCLTRRTQKPRRI